MTRRDRFEMKALTATLSLVGLLLCIGYALFAFKAGAQGVANVGAPVPAPMGPSIASQLLAIVLVPLVTLAGSALVWFLTVLSLHFRQMAKTNRLYAALAVGTELLSTGVAHAEVELKPQFEANPAMTPAEVGAATKAAVLKEATQNMPAAALKVLTANLGDGLSSWMSGKLEQAVSAQASPGTAALKLDVPAAAVQPVQAGPQSPA